MPSTQEELDEQYGNSRSVTGWVRIQLPDVIKTRLISILMVAKMQLLEVVTGHSQFLSHFSIPQAMPTQPVTPRPIQYSMQYQALGYFHFNILRGLYWKIVPFLQS